MVVALLAERFASNTRGYGFKPKSSAICFESIFNVNCIKRQNYYQEAESDPNLTFYCWGSGCGSVGRAVASDSSSNPVIAKFILNIYCQLYRKDENKRKRGRDWPI